MKTSDYVIEKFKNYFEKNDHYLHQYAPLAPTEQETTMFNIAGMQQFTDIFIGKKETKHKRIITIQPCLRVNDLENIGKTKRHHSFFEMLGNFSFGDYFKKEAINLAFEFLTKELNINKDYLYITVHHEDQETYDIWQEKMPNKIIKIESDDNFWRAGNFGPCGPCTEIFFDSERERFDSERENNVNLNFVKTSIKNGEDRFLEIWNIVFMQYNSTVNGLEEIKNKCIDTGIGLERLVSVVDETFDNYKTDLIEPIVTEANKFVNNITHCKIIADHMRSIVFLIGEGLLPGNEGQSYVLKNLIRRALIYIDDLTPLIEITKKCLSRYTRNLIYIDNCKDILEKEQNKFIDIINNSKKLICLTKVIDETFVFKLFDTYGMPIEISKELLIDKNINWDIVEELKKEHSSVSRKKLIIDFHLPTLQLDFNIYEYKSEILFLGILSDDILDYKFVNTINRNSGTCLLITKESCFYPRGGGQDGDKGIIITNDKQFIVTDTIKQKISNSVYIIVHIGHVSELTSNGISVGEIGTMKIDLQLRQANTRAHSATHLLSEFFIKKYDCKVVGSNVSNDYLRMDLETNLNNLKLNNLKYLLPEAELYVNNIIEQNIQRSITHEKFEDVVGAISGDRCNYSEIVRVVEYQGVSKQLCGGTHVKQTSDIYSFKIIEESSIRKNVRRLVAITGENAINYKKTAEIKKEKENKILNFVDNFSMIFEAKEIFIEYYNGNNEAKILSIIKKNPEESYVFLLINEKTHKFILSNINDKFLNIIKQEYSLKGGGNSNIKFFNISNFSNFENMKTYFKKF